MCFNFEVSIGTFLLSWSISIYLLSKGLNKKQKQNVIFLMIFSCIQLADAILWYNKMKKNNINYIVTSFIIPFILSLQILYNVFIRNNNKNIFMTLFAITVIIMIFKKFNGYSESLCSNKIASPVWGSNELNVWDIIIFGILILYPINYQIDKIIIIITGIIATMMSGAHGSLWCAIANVVSLYYLYKY